MNPIFFRRPNPVAASQAIMSGVALAELLLLGLGNGPCGCSAD